MKKILIMKILLFLSFPLLFNCEDVKRTRNDYDYNRMPELFSIDDYDDCFRNKNGLYCFITLELHAGKDPDLYKIIQEYSTHIMHFNHTLLDRGICVSKTCKTYNNNTEYKEEEIKSILGEYYNETIWNNYELFAEVQTIHYCTKTENYTKDTDLKDWITTFVVIAILVLNLLGTIYHKYLYEKQGNQYSQFLMSFSLYRNWNDLFNKDNNLIKKPDQPKQTMSFEAVQGVRVISSLFIVFTHSIFYVVVFTDAVQDFEKIQTKAYFQVFKYGLNLVQLLFCVSGFLLAYKFCEYEEKASVSWRDIPKIIFARFIRLTPSYAVVLLLIMTFSQYFASGPLWNIFAGIAASDCHKYFWHHMIYVNNYVSEDLRCALQTWHVAADMQVSIVGIIVLTLTKLRRMPVLWLMLAASFIGPVVDILNGFDPVAMFTPQFWRNLDNNTFRFSHIRGHNNLTCFTVSMIMGKLNFDWQKRGMKSQSKLLAIALNSTPAILIALFLSNDMIYTADSQPTLATKLLFVFMFRILLSITLALGITAIVMKVDCTLYRVLTWSGWEVPSKLCYCVYLIHMGILNLLMGTRTTKATLSLLHLVTTFSGVTVISFILATALYISVEAPCNKLFKSSAMMQEFSKKMAKKIE